MEFALAVGWKGREFRGFSMDEKVKQDGWLELLFLRPLRGWRGWTVYLVILGLLGAVYFTLAGQVVAQTNLDLRRSDQLANMMLARESAQDWYPHRSNYIQPLWPWISRVVMSENDEEFYLRGRWLNLSIGYAVMVLLAIAAAWWMAPIPGLTIGLLTGIGLMLQRAHFFQPEPLLYALLAATAVFMALSLWRGRWLDYLGWGLFLGLAYLAKGSTGPLVAVYFGATAVMFLARAGWCPRWLCGRTPPGPSVGRHAAGILGGLLLAGALIAPNAVFKYRVHDDPFHSVVKYWMWCDDWETEADPLYPLVNTAEARARFAPGELPTGANYLRKHGFAHAWKRWTTGVTFMTERFVIPIRVAKRALFFERQGGKTERGEPPQLWRYFFSARGLYLCWFLALGALLLGVRTVQRGGPLFRSPAALAITAFVTAMTLLYLAAFGWYAVIGNGERFTLMLYLPLLIALAWGTWVLGREMSGRWRWVYAIGVAAVFVHASVQTALLLAYPQFGPSL
jgi:hypothetical protein